MIHKRPSWPGPRDDDADDADEEEEEEHINSGGDDDVSHLLGLSITAKVTRPLETLDPSFIAFSPQFSWVVHYSRR